jgi:hypothetical protein
MATDRVETTTSDQAPDPTAAAAEHLRALERERCRALVTGDLDRARELHTEDFQLINPGGAAVTKEQYLGGLAAGTIKYLLFEPQGEIAVRVYGPVALLRYQSELEIVVQGQAVPRMRCWHTDAYELRDGRWQAVWSQATTIQHPTSQVHILSEDAALPEPRAG